MTNPGYSPLMEALRLAPGKGTLTVLHSGTVTHWKNAMNTEISLEVKKFFSWVAHGIYLLISHVLATHMQSCIPLLSSPLEVIPPPFSGSLMLS